MQSGGVGRYRGIGARQQAHGARRNEEKPRAHEHDTRATMSLQTASGYRCLCVYLILLGCSACQPLLPVGPAEDLGVALAEVWSDQLLTCQENCARNQYNFCPELRLGPGTDETGVTWLPDRFFFGLLPNPYHAPLDCLRGTSDELGMSSYQCCYDGENLVTDGPLAGSFDFVDPSFSILAAISHFILDILPGTVCGC